MSEAEWKVGVYPTNIDGRGRVLVPVELRRVADVQLGDELAWIDRDSGIWMEKLNQDG